MDNQFNAIAEILKFNQPTEDKPSTPKEKPSFPIEEIATSVERLAELPTISTERNVISINSAIYARLRMVKIKGLNTSRLINAILLDFITKNKEILDTISVKPIV